MTGAEQDHHNLTLTSQEPASVAINAHKTILIYDADHKHAM